MAPFEGFEGFEGLEYRFEGFEGLRYPTLYESLIRGFTVPTVPSFQHWPRTVHFLYYWPKFNAKILTLKGPKKIRSLAQIWARGPQFGGPWNTVHVKNTVLLCSYVLHGRMWGTVQSSGYNGERWIQVPWKCSTSQESIRSYSITT